MTHTKASFAGNNARRFYDRLQQPTPSFSTSNPPFPSSHAFPRKRSRSEFDDTHPPHHIYKQTPSKQPKLFHPNYNNPPPTQPHNAPPIHRTFDDDTKNNLEKNRGFQNHDDKLYANGSKHRKENILNQRRQQREIKINQKHQNAKMCNPAYYNWPHSRDPSVESMDSDEIMTEYPKNDENRNHSNTNPPRHHYNPPPFSSATSAYYSHSSRYSCIPKTCPSARKYRSRMNANYDARPPTPPQQQQQPPPQQMNETHSNPFPNHETPPNIHSNNHNDSHHAMNDAHRMNACYINTDINTQTSDGVHTINIEDSEQEMAATEGDYKQPERDKEADKERARKREEKKKAQDALVQKRAEQRIEEMKNDKINEAHRERQKNELRDRIHPQIIQKAHVFRNNPIELIKLFYPKTRITRDAESKDVVRAFKRALAHFHPDRTINKSLEEQITAEEVFKLLSQEKETYEKKQNDGGGGRASYNRYNASYNRHRKQRHGWF